MWETYDITLNRSIHNSKNHQETLMVFVNFAIHEALTFLSYMRMFVNSSLQKVSAWRSFQYNTYALKSQIVPVILTAQCNPSLKLLMRLYGSTVSRVR